MADVNLSFDEIPDDFLKPGTYVEVKPNYKTVGVLPIPAKALLLVQKLAAGTAIAATRYQITRDEDGDVLFGVGSIGSAMCRAFRKANKTTPLYAMAAADAAGGAAATGKIAFTGTGSGEIDVYVKNIRVPVSASNANAAAWATATVAALAAVPSLPVTAAVGGTTSEVVLTAKHKGVSGNDIDVRLNRFDDEVMPTGLTAVITAMATGTTNPDVTPLLDAISNEWYTDIAMAWDDAANLTVLAAELKDRYRAMVGKDAHAYVGHRGSFGTLITKGALTNSQNLSPIGAKNAPSAPWEWAANLCGVASFQLTNDPARQLRSLELVGIAGPDPIDRFEPAEQNLLLGAGISTFEVLPDGTVTIDRVVTAYKVSPLGAVDRAWLDVMVPKVLTRVRYDWKTYVTLNYPRHKLADDFSPAAEANSDVATPRKMHASWGARCKVYETQAWIEDVTRTVSESVFARSTSDRNRLNASQQIRIIGNLIVFGISLEFQV